MNKKLLKVIFFKKNSYSKNIVQNGFFKTLKMMFQEVYKKIW